MKKKYLLIIEYEGTAYHGWQVQKNGITVQEVVEKALSKITKTETTVFSSGRTDAGVHAEGMPAQFVTESKMKPYEFLFALNSHLPLDITIREVRKVPMAFNARGSAKQKLLSLHYFESRSSLGTQLSPFLVHPSHSGCCGDAQSCKVLCRQARLHFIPRSGIAMPNRLYVIWIVSKFIRKTVFLNWNLKVKDS